MTSPIPFILASTDLGSMIVNRLDYRMVSENQGYGVGFQLLETGAYDPAETDLLKHLLFINRTFGKPGNEPLNVIDVGANIGIHTVALAKHLGTTGTVTAIEAQERIYYALAGNIALNNCFNARAVYAAAGREVGTIQAPQPNYCVPASFGSLELRYAANTEFIGQPIDYNEDKLIEVPMISVDSLNLKNVALIKVDVEGMEMEVLAGASTTIEAQRPMLAIEHIKINPMGLKAWLDTRDYVSHMVGMNVVACHKDDPAIKEFSVLCK